MNPRRGEHVSSVSTLNIRKEPNLGNIGTQIDFGGVKETVVTRDDFSLQRARETLSGEIIATIGYGRQGSAQALNLRDNKIGNGIVGVRPGSSYDKAVKDGWIPGVNLFSVEDALKRGSIIQILLPDSEQVPMWPKIKPLLRKGQALYFSHGFGITYSKQTGIIPPSDIDVIMVAPKGAGWTVRDHFLHQRGINSSFAIAQNATARALTRTLAMGIGIGSGFLFPTTFKKESDSDLTGERGDLIGALDGLGQAAYANLKEIGFTSEEAAKLSIVKITHVISKILGEKGADGLINEIPKELLPAFTNSFKATLEAAEPVFRDLYERVASGFEAERVIEVSTKSDYLDIPDLKFKGTLSGELDAIENSEIEKTAAMLRKGIKEGSVVIPASIGNVNEAIIAGALLGLMHAQYNLFRGKGHNPSEADNESKEEATQSLYPTIDRDGMAAMYKMCSLTAQRGALDWNPVFKNVFQKALKSIYQGQVEHYPGIIDQILSSEMLKADKKVMELRPENQRVA